MLLIAVALILVIAITRVSERFRAETTQRLNAGIAMYVTDELALIDASGVNQAALRELAHRAMTINPSVEIYLLSPTGEVLATLVDRGRLLRSHVDLQPLMEFLAGSLHGPLYGDDPTSASTRSVFSVAEIRTREQLSGYLYVILASNRYASVTAAVKGSYSLQVALLIVAAVLTLTLAAGAMLFRRLTLPLRQLQARMQSWSQKMELSCADSADNGTDEIAALSEQFALLSERINEQIREIDARDMQRRELIASVSHDLRTPLAALRGYLETVQIKDETLDTRQRRAYLATAHRHALHLEQLIAALFQLSKLEAGLIKPRLECFSIDELLHDVAVRFQLRAEQAGIRLTADVHGGDSTAHGDLALIERALANLIDNALRHTPPGGEIVLSSRAHAAAMRVAVSDTGCGMPNPTPCGEDDAASGTLTRTLRSKFNFHGRTGLGLAIVRRIVRLHDAELIVESEPGRGTRVAFDLALASATKFSPTSMSFPGNAPICGIKQDARPSAPF
jgi:two-component system, OmpR family, sensor kinase